MSGGAYWGLYVVQLVVAAVIFFTNPKRNDLTAKEQKMRTGAIAGGIIPLVPIGFVVAMFWLARYRFALASNDRLRSRLQPNMPTSFGAATATAGPAAEDSALKPAKPASDNPFL